MYDAGAPIQLSCLSTSYPPVDSYKWYKKLNNVSNVVPVQSGQNLTVRPDHPGIYHCYASNEIGGTDSNPVRLFLNSQYTSSCSDRAWFYVSLDTEVGWFERLAVVLTAVLLFFQFF